MKLMVLTAALCALALAQVGLVDTVGGTTCDWQLGGPPYEMLINSPGHGIHVLWTHSASEQTTYPDRNMRYNFYNYATREWRWIDPSDFMQSGFNAFTERAGLGNLGADPGTGVAYVSTHLGTPLRPKLARDVSPGAGLFEYCDSRPNAEGYLWPRFAVDAAGVAHFALIDDASRDQLFYSKVDPWGEFSVPIRVAPPQPEPYYPCHNIAASRVSRKVCLTWTYTEGNPDPGFYRLSTDGGTSWQAPEELPWPPAYGGDTLTSYHITSLFPHFDASDELHIVASVMPFIGSQGFIAPAQLWHWRPNNSPHWSHIHTADPDTILAPVGYNALIACRVSIGSDPDGNLFVAWEEFDGRNVEPGPPELLRADIFHSHSGDNGRTWAEAVRITTHCSVSYRFPAMMDHITDTVAVSYLIDQVAGFHVQGQGPATRNPYVVQRWQNPYTGIKESPRPTPRSPLSGPTITRGVLSLPRDPGAGHNPILPGESGLCPKPAQLLDATGRKVMELQPGENDVRHLAPGVYFVRQASGVMRDASSVHKVIIQR